MSSSPVLPRRRLLLLAGSGVVAAGAAYTYARGIRLPLFHFTDSDPPTRWKQEGTEVAAEGAVFQQLREGAFRFRAFVPEPRFVVKGENRSRVRIMVENLHRDAVLRPGSSSLRERLTEKRDNLTRIIDIEPGSSEGLAFSWRFPKSERFRFAAIGDTGGGTELAWVLKRASQLKADFLLHMGDFYYEKGDLKRAAAHLNEAEIPTYAAIGNHDFHKGLRALYPRFNQLIGPSNSIFALGGIEFVNMDTAADFLPADRGPRARIIEGLRPIVSGEEIRDRVVFTHKPLRDPDRDRDHDVDLSSEARWLRERLLATGTRNLLVGHIHVREEFDDYGLHTYVSGQGLAHADLIVERPYADILLGDVEPGEPVKYQWKPLNMPFEAHCNARNLGVLDALERPDVKARLKKLCGKT